jgi:hypothetical protein
MQMLSVVWLRNISCNQTRKRASAQAIMGYDTHYSLQFVTNLLSRLSFLAHYLTFTSRTQCWSMLISIDCAFLVYLVFEGFSMLCFLLIHFREDIEIDGMLVDHFQEKSKLRLSFLISKFVSDHRPQQTH